MSIKTFEIISNRIPIVNINIHKDFYRHDILNFLTGCNSVGIELGVAGGHYSKRMVDSGKFSKIFGVDLYEDHHNTAEYKSALSLIGLDKNYVLLRMSFMDAVDLFDDNFFDFIYFDGYAHTGEEGGKFFSEWYKKLKVGGVFAGDDYHDDWPLVKWAVNDMISKIGCNLNVTGKVESTYLNKYPSWFFLKEKNSIFSSDNLLVEIGERIRNETQKIGNDNGVVINVLNKYFKNY